MSKTDPPKLKIEYLDPRKLDPTPNNPRLHSPEQIQQLVESIEEFDFTNPILIDPDKNIIAGHGRHEAALELNLESVPVIRLPHLTQKQIQAYIIADNKLAENATWNEDLLKKEMEKLQDGGFDLLLTGFQDFELDEILTPTKNITDAEEIITKQTIQMEPPQEYLLILAKDQAQWDEMVQLFKLEKVRRGGYRKGSPRDQASIERILDLERVTSCILQSQAKGEQAKPSQTNS